VRDIVLCSSGVKELYRAVGSTERSISCFDTRCAWSTRLLTKDDCWSE